MERETNIVDGNWRGRFFALWTSQALSLFGSALVSFALIWHLALTTNSAVVLATAALMSLLPQVFLGPLAGVLVDRWNRRAILMMADSAIAAATAGLAFLFLLGIVEPWHIYALAFLRAVGGGFHGPAMLASTALMVPKQQLTRVQGLNQALQGGLNIVAAPVAAFLLGWLPMQGILLIDIVTALAAVGLLLAIPIPQPARPEGSTRAADGFRATLADLRDGILYVGRWTGLCLLLAMGVFFNALLQPALTLLPILVRRSLDGTAAMLGGIQAAYGVGAVLGGLVLGVWGGFPRRAQTVAFGLAGLGLSLVGAGVWPAGGAVWLGGCLFAAGLMMAVIHGALFAIIQAVVAPEMQGRVFTLTLSVVGVAVPLGLAFAGPLAEQVGAEVWFVAAGAACVAMGGLALATPAVQRMEQSGG